MNGSTPRNDGNVRLRAYYLLVVSFTMSVIQAVTLPLIPYLAYRLGASQILIGTIGSIGALLYCIGTLISGLISVITTPTIPFFLSLSSYSLAALCYSFLVHSPVDILIVRIIEGIAWGFLWPPLEAILTEAFISQSDVVPLFSFSWSSGMVLGSLLSGLSLSHDPILTFLPCSFTSVCCLLAGLPIFRAVKVKSLRNDRISLSFIIRSIKNNKVWLLASIYSFPLSIIFTFFPSHAILWGLAEIIIPLTLFGVMTSRSLTFLLIKRYLMDRRLRMSLGCILSGIGLLLFGTFHDLSVVLILCSILIGSGAGLIYASTLHSALDTPFRLRSIYTALFEFSIGLGYLIGPLIGGIIAEFNLAMTYILASLVPLGMGLIFISLGRRNLLPRSSS